MLKIDFNGYNCGWKIAVTINWRFHAPVMNSNEEWAPHQNCDWMAEPCNTDGEKIHVRIRYIRYKQSLMCARSLLEHTPCNERCFLFHLQDVQLQGLYVNSWKVIYIYCNSNRWINKEIFTSNIRSIFVTHRSGFLLRLFRLPSVAKARPVRDSYDVKSQEAHETHISTITNTKYSNYVVKYNFTIFICFVLFLLDRMLRFWFGTSIAIIAHRRILFSTPTKTVT